MAQLKTGMTSPRRRLEASAIFPASQGASIPPTRPTEMTMLKAVPVNAAKRPPTMARVVG